jgi:hypothetical protein
MIGLAAPSTGNTTLPTAKSAGNWVFKQDVPAILTVMLVAGDVIPMHLAICYEVWRRSEPRAT